MTVYYTQYVPETGEIRGGGSVADLAGLQLQKDLYPTDGFIPEPSDIDNDRVDISTASHRVVPRSSFPIVIDRTTIPADGETPAQIIGIPVGTKVTLLRSADFPEVVEIVNDGETTLRTLHRLPHVFRLELFPFRTTEVTIYGV